MIDDFTLLANAIGYKKIQRVLNAIGNQSFEALNELLRLSISDTYAILLFPSRMIQVSPYGISISRAYSISGGDNYITVHPELNEKFLRTVFTGFELIAYKLCHLCFENQRHDYTWETEKTRARIRKIIEIAEISERAAYETLFDEIFFVRDAFAHSFVEIERIKYCGVPLGDCFGDTWLGSSHRDSEKIFVDDLNALFSPLMALFTKHQLKQIDANKFAKLCDELLGSRTLGPTH